MLFVVWSAPRKSRSKPSPFTRANDVSAMPSPFVSRYAVRSGGCMTYTVFPSATTPRGLSISAKVVYVSARPSPLLSTSRITRPTPFSVESERFGSTHTNTAPSGDSPTQVGYIATGGPANSVTSNPAGALNAAWSFCSAAASRGTGPLFGIGAGRGGGAFAAGACARRSEVAASEHASRAAASVRHATWKDESSFIMETTAGTACTWSGGVLVTRRRVRLDVVALVGGGLRVHAPFEVQEPDVAEVDRVPFRLERDEAGAQRLAFGELRGIDVGHHTGGLTRVRVDEHRIVVDDVLHDGVAEHVGLGEHPLVAVVGLRRGVDAVACVRLAGEVDHRAGRAHVAGGAWTAVAQPAEVLVLDRDGKVLVARHRAWVLRVDHQAAVAQRVA